MTPDRSHSETVGRVANKVRVEVGEAPFKPYFYVLKYPSSDALPVPEIFYLCWVRHISDTTATDPITNVR